MAGTSGPYANWIRIALRPESDLTSVNAGCEQCRRHIVTGVGRLIFVKTAVACARDTYQIVPDEDRAMASCWWGPHMFAWMWFFPLSFVAI